MFYTLLEHGKVQAFMALEGVFVVEVESLKRGPWGTVHFKAVCCIMNWGPSLQSMDVIQHLSV